MSVCLSVYPSRSSEHSFHQTACKLQSTVTSLIMRFRGWHYGCGLMEIWCICTTHLWYFSTTRMLTKSIRTGYKLPKKIVRVADGGCACKDVIHTRVHSRSLSFWIALLRKIQQVQVFTTTCCPQLYVVAKKFEEILKTFSFSSYLYLYFCRSTGFLESQFRMLNLLVVWSNV